MKKSSKFFAAALAAVLAFSVTGCAGADSSGEASSAAPSAAAPETSAESTAAFTERFQREIPGCKRGLDLCASGTGLC